MDAGELSLSQANCRAKTGKGNVFRCKKEAKCAASQHRRRCGCPDVVWYRCQHCGLYHLGTRRTPEEQLARAWERIEAARQKQWEMEWEQWWSMGGGNVDGERQPDL